MEFCNPKQILQKPNIKAKISKKQTQTNKQKLMFFQAHIVLLDTGSFLSFPLQPNILRKLAILIDPIHVTHTHTHTHTHTNPIPFICLGLSNK